MNDRETNLSQIKELVRQFVDEREWRQFHSPKNLAMALAVEAAELMEHFQWLTTDASREVVADTEKLTAIGEEMADVFCYLAALANELNVDLSAAVERKMELNRRKYPVDEIRGRYGHDDPKRAT